MDVLGGASIADVVAAIVAEVNASSAASEAERIDVALQRIEELSEDAVRHLLQQSPG
jgi:hypothetical protein